MNYRLSLFAATFLLLISGYRASAQTIDTLTVQTLTYDSLGRDGVYKFPDTGTFERVIMQYSMRCHHALVSNGTQTEQGCGQWDYNCETYLWDSTRTDSLRNIAPSAVVSNYLTNTNFPYTTNASSSIIRRDEKIVSYPSGTAFIGTTTAPDSTTLEWNQPYNRSYFLISKSDQSLIAAKKSSPISGIRLDIGPFTTLHDLRIRMHLVKAGSYTPLSIYTDNSFIEVYHATTVLKAPFDTLLFYKPFVIDSISDVVMEMSWSGISGSPLDIKCTPGAIWEETTTPEHALSFAGSELIPIPTPTLSAFTKAISIAFWAYGDTSYLPGSNSVFCEGLDDARNRQINIHLPWSDGSVYWDCGGDGSGNFDRIQKAAAKLDAAGRWNHWVFTKDAVSGKMAIYLNGSLWMSDTGKHRPINAKQMMLGGAISSGIGWYGDVRQFAMFDRALDSAEVMRIMLNDTSIPPLNPRTYLPMNDGTSNSITNSALPGLPAIPLQGIAVWHTILGKDLPNNYGSFNFQPRIVLYQLANPATPQITDHYTFDTIPDHAHIVTKYAVGHSYGHNVNDSLNVTTTTLGDYLAKKSYTFDESGKKVDSVNVAAQDTVRPTNLYYWTRSPQKYELMSFVTPYGINLDLGKTGKMWEFDVTDYLPVMKGMKRLTMERGSGQEEFDLRFLFIKGTPTRNVLDMQQLWPMTEENYQTIQADNRYAPLSVYMNPAAKGFKLRSYITGHGQQGEFEPQTHYLSVNGKKYARLVYKICSLDPLYPQGGTWPADRSGWCPGMATDLSEYEITGTVNPGDSAKMDYGVEGGSGDSRYDPGTQLVSYGAPNFKLDAAIVEIQRPSAKIAYARINPACDEPMILIRNNGTDSLKSLQFEYYVTGGPHQTYNWTGKLAFLDTISVALPIDDLSFWTSVDTGLFHVDISAPNGGTDQYDQNNHYSSTYIQPPSYTGTVVVNFVSNNQPDDNYYEVLDKAGNTVFSNGGFTAKTTYYDSLILPVGCYTLVFHDDGEDGIAYWANTNQGTGSLRFRQSTKSGKVLKTFNPDMGGGTQYDFSITSSPLAVGTSQPMFRRVALYPNPTRRELSIDLEGMPPGMIALEVIDATGRIIHREQRFTDPLGGLRVGMDIGGNPPGSYILRVVTSDGQTTQNFVVE